MATSVHRRDINGNDPFCILGNILAIIPPNTYLTQDVTGRRRYWYKCYASVVFFIMLCANIQSLWGRSANSYPFYTMLITDTAVNLSMIATNLLIILIPTFCQMDNYLLFKDISLKVNHCLDNSKEGNMKKCTLFYIELIVGHVIFFSTISYDAYVWISGMGMGIYHNYIFRDFQRYHLSIAVVIMYNFALSMHYKLKQTNSKLEEMLSFPLLGDSIPDLDAHQEKLNLSNKVRQISLIYQEQILQINLYNKFFGWQILFLALTIMIGVVNALDIAITFTCKFPETFQSKRFGIDLIILSCICSMWHILLGILVTASCNTAWQEAQRTGDLCFGILLRLPVTAESKEDERLQDELALLAQIVTHRCPVFSAAGFFTINYNMVLAIFGSVTTYVIVLMQFNKF